MMFADAVKGNISLHDHLVITVAIKCGGGEWCRLQKFLKKFGVALRRACQALAVWLVIHVGDEISHRVFYINSIHGFPFNKKSPRGDLVIHVSYRRLRILKG